jgi:hypothetical protein
MICARFPEYKAAFDRSLGVALKIGIESTGRPFGEVVAEIVASYKGAGLEEELTLTGKGLANYKAQLLTRSVALYGVKFDNPLNEISGGRTIRHWCHLQI